MNLGAIIVLPRALTIAGALLLAGCVSYSGSNLVSGVSTAADVEATMGRPAETRALAGGGSVWYYSRGPIGRHNYVVTLGADNVVRSVDQRLADEYFKQVVPGTTTMKQVRELLGPPHEAARYERQKRTVWQYNTLRVAERRLFFVDFSDDGVVLEVLNKHDDRFDGPSESGRL
jgi:hypothetical protein